MRVYSYIVTHDTGFAPNPYWDYCTLACCKPLIRRTAQQGDWIIGLSPKAKGNKLIYAMQVTEKPLTFKQYFKDKRFKKKIPKLNSKAWSAKCGDNIYKPLPDGEYQQLPSLHSQKNGKENPENKKHD